MNYFPKTAYWRPLVPNSESVDNKTNPCFKSYHDPYVVDDEAESVVVKHFLKYTSVSLISQQLIKYEEFCE